MNKYIIAFVLFSSIGSMEVQAEDDMSAAKKIVVEMYKMNIYEHECSTLKPGVSRAHAEKILAKADNYNYPLKAREIYDWKKEERVYWDKIFNAIYVGDVAREYVNRCDNRYHSKNDKENYLDDFRFPKEAGDIASFHIKKVNFKEVSSSATKIHGIAKIDLNKGKSFSLHCVLYKTPAGWRVFDIFEMQRAADRDDEFFVANSLQEGLAELKKNR